MVIATLNGLDRVPRVLLQDRAHPAHEPVATASAHDAAGGRAAICSPGVKLAVAYSFIGVIAGEFILSRRRARATRSPTPTTTSTTRRCMR